MSSRQHPLADQTLWLPGQEVRSNVDPEGGTVMNLRTGKYYALNPVGALIWSELETGASRQDLLRVLSQRYPEAEERLPEDLDRWLKTLDAQGMVMQRRPDADPGLGQKAAEIIPGEAARVEPSLPSGVRRELESALAADSKLPGRLRRARWFVLAWTALAFTDLLLKGLGFHGFYRFIRGRSVRSRRRLDPAELVGLCSVINSAARYYFKRAWCLQRSAVMTVLLRSQGFPVELVIGVRRLPFMAHAWVEWGGVVINDDRRVRTFYHVMERC